ncbi:MAG: hypothetical protein ABII00_19230 [Elusimicrobiota bacterium]
MHEIDEAAKARGQFTAAGLPLDTLRARFNKLNESQIPPRLAAVSEEMKALEDRTTALEEVLQAAVARDSLDRDRAGLAKEAAAIGVAGGGLWKTFVSLSGNIDNMGNPTEAKPIAARDTANPVAERLAVLSDRLRGLREKLGIEPAARREKEPAGPEPGVGIREGDDHFRRYRPSWSKPWMIGLKVEEGLVPQADRPDPVPGPSAIPSEPKRRPDIEARTTTTEPRGKNLADVPRPALPRERSYHPAFRWPLDYFDAMRRNETKRKPSMSERAALVRVGVRQYLGGSSTVGDPYKRADLVHRQAGGTCSIVAQQQILKECGALPDGNPRKQETELYEQATRLDYFDGSSYNAMRRWEGGTPWQYVGNLLSENGMIVRKTARAKDAQFVDAVSTGKMLLVDVEVGTFYDDPAHRGAFHSIVITGAELSKGNDELLGVYVNDSNTTEAARFVPKDQFLKAWRAAGSRIIEAM